MTNGVPFPFESQSFFSSVALSADGGVRLVSVYGGGIWIWRALMPPKLNALSAANNLTLSWTIPSTNFTLQQNPDLTTTNWSMVTNVPTSNLNNLQNQVTLPAPGGNMFYRLQSL